MLNNLSTLSSFLLLVDSTAAECNNTYNCSGHGACVDGECICEVQYAGDNCTNTNLSYYIAFGLIFFLLCAVSFTQLVLCIKSSFSKMDKPSLSKACRVTTQKLLYALVFFATFSRGLYFALQEHIDEYWANGLQAAYYPILITGFSLIICFWAEAFHLERVEGTPSFLSKSFTSFIIFNVFVYLLLGLQFILVYFSDSRDYLARIFITCYAVLMLFNVILFLAYGVEVFFKVHGAFTTASSSFNITQLHQSRVGLVSQALLQIIAVLFLLLHVTSHIWKENVDIMSWNVYNIVFRTVEIGLVLWFPCVLWNWESPEKLWILNPRSWLKGGFLMKIRPHPSYETTADTVPGAYDCWICYDPERTDAGALIQPCNCKGDVATVHHDCLQKWLMETSINNPENIFCKVCKEEYQIRQGHFTVIKGCRGKHMLLTGSIVFVMIATPIAAYCLCLRFPDTVIQIVSVGVCLLVEYISLKLLGFGFMNAYQRA
uniref:Uncharacterized protein LOC102810141 n=1 Tax=Saccoglossus kowalevskii TaxID=10224 RepID=A0ABM0MK70_SACKO|nr:PREDICTED: uncharacterized protein LOC102810141 [Saccoglossus kowalevskii]